jgi:hypothetical protein
MNNTIIKSGLVQKFQEVKENKGKKDSERLNVTKSDKEPGRDFILSNTWLKVAAIISFSMAACQAVISISPNLASYFEAPPALSENRFLLFVTGGSATLILVIFGLYALSGAGKIRRLPLLPIVLILISSLFLLRGSFVILTVLKYLKIIEGKILIRELLSHLVFLVAGFTYTGGTILNWGKMDKKNEV